MTDAASGWAQQKAPQSRRADDMTDRWAIFDLVARFDDAVNRRDVPEFRKLWADDAVWEIGKPRPMRAEGVDTIVGNWKQLLDTMEWLFRGSFAGVVVVDGQSGTGRWPCVETGTFAKTDTKAEAGYDNRAVYEDDYVKSDGMWLFKKRLYRYLWLSSAPLPGGPIFEDSDAS